MFCDLVASTALSARLDPEDLREVIAAYHRAVAQIVTGFDGFVADRPDLARAGRPHRRACPQSAAGYQP
jgi:class 3 adenylate cyclase